jgi:hypothetical protein
MRPSMASLIALTVLAFGAARVFAAEPPPTPSPSPWGAPPGGQVQVMPVVADCKTAAQLYQQERTLGQQATAERMQAATDQAQAQADLKQPTAANEAAAKQLQADAQKALSQATSDTATAASDDQQAHQDWTAGSCGAWPPPTT